MTTVNIESHTPPTRNTKEPRILVREIDRSQAEWFQQREGKVSGSNIATICGINQFCSPLELWCRWTKKTSSSFVSSPAMRLGLHMEPLLADLFRERTGLEVTRSNQLVQDAELDWLVCSPDFIIAPDGNPLEIKTGSPRTAYRWKDGAPLEYILQVQLQLRVLQKRRGVITGYLGDIDDLRDVGVEYDPQLWGMTQERAERFLECVAKDVPPDAGPNDATLIRSIIKREEGKRVQWSGKYEVDAEYNIAMIRDATRELKRLKVEVDLCEEKKKRSENNLRLLLGDADHGSLSDGTVVRLTTVTVGERVTKPYSYDRVIIPKDKAE